MPCSARLVLLGPLLLSGCSGLGVFLDDTHGIAQHPNRPIGNSEMIRRAEGRPITIEPMQPETGNVWPGPVKPEITLEDLAKEPAQPLPNLPGTVPPSIANVPGLVVPVIPHHFQPRPGGDAGVLTGPLTPTPAPAPVPSTGLPSGRPEASPQGTVTPTPRGAAVSTSNPSGLGQATPLDSKLGITVPNGDGTSTVISPSGAISTIPTPK